MINFTDFFNRYNGQQNIGDTTENKGQCVGLVAVWIDELNLPHIWGNACDLFANADEQFFEKILNTPDGVPSAGDIIVWSAKFNGTVGHTGIATGTGDLNTFECFEQNDPTGSNCHLKVYNYLSVIGWLRPKELQDQQTLINELRADRDKNWNLYQGALTKQIELESAVESKNKSIDALTTENTSLKSTVEMVTKQNSEYSTSIQSLTAHLQEVEGQLQTCNALINKKDLAQYTTKQLVKEVFKRFHL